MSPAGKLALSAPQEEKQVWINEISSSIDNAKKQLLQTSLTLPRNNFAMIFWHWEDASRNRSSVEFAGTETKRFQTAMKLLTDERHYVSTLSKVVRVDYTKVITLTDYSILYNR